MGRFKEMLIDMMNEEGIPHRFLELDERPIRQEEVMPTQHKFTHGFTNFLKEDIKETEINNKLNRENMLEWEDDNN